MVFPDVRSSGGPSMCIARSATLAISPERCVKLFGTPKASAHGTGWRKARAASTALPAAWRSRL